MLLLLLLCLLACAHASDQLLVDHEDVARKYDYRLSIKKPYKFFNDIPYFDLKGNAIASPDSIRLTTSVPQMKGSVWSKDPNPFSAWQIHFSVSVSGRSYIGENGIAIWYTLDRATEGPVYGSTDKWTGIGIFLDSSDSSMNRVTPYVSGYLNDGNMEFGAPGYSESTLLGGCFRDFRNSPKPTWGRLTYANRTLQVGKVYLDLDVMQDGYSFTECFTYTGIDLPAGYFFGVSASTGNYIADDHDLFSFETFEMEPKAKQTKRKNIKLDPDMEKKIQEIRKVVDDSQKKEERTGEPGYQEVFSKPRVLNEILESQFKVIENLNLLHKKAGLAPVVAAGLHDSAKSHVRDAVGSVDATVESIGRKVDEVSDHIKVLSDHVQNLFIAFRDFNTQGDVGMNDVNAKLQQSQEKLEAANQAIKDSPSSSHWGFSLTFFLLGGIIVYAVSIFVRMGKNDSKRFSSMPLSHIETLRQLEPFREARYIQDHVSSMTKPKLQQLLFHASLDYDGTGSTRDAADPAD
ncbi:hypothetical protein HDU67_009875 [Dinochytrium kinnereticum]|nr:hypothetical protein HDU67_009875 [Dinochytrium kinnereticum]